MASTVWRGQLTFGLVSVPVRLYRAARKERVRMHYVAAEEPRQWKPSLVESIPADDRDEEEAPVAPPVSRVTQSLHTAEEDRPVSRGDLLKAHEVAPDQYVTFTQQEIRALRPQTSTEMQIVRSVHLEEIDPVFFETSYYVVPDRGGERAYSLLFAALKESRYVALATVAMHGREHVVILRPAAKGLLAHTMFYQDEVRAENEHDAKIGEVLPKELALAKTFVEAIAAPFNPGEFKDTHREKLEALIAEKSSRRDVAASHPEAKPVAPAIDIMEALRRSIEAQKKPAAKETRASETKTGARKKRA